MKAYSYITVANDSESRGQVESLIEKLEQGYKIISAVATQFCIHYILELESKLS